MTFELKDLPPWLIAMVAVGGVVGGLVVGWLRSRFSGDFARRSDVEALGVRVGAVETRVASMPNHADISVLATRVGEVERGVAVVSAEVRGAKEVLEKTARGVDMLVTLHLKEGRD